MSKVAATASGFQPTRQGNRTWFVPPYLPVLSCDWHSPLHRWVFGYRDGQPIVFGGIKRMPGTSKGRYRKTLGVHDTPGTHYIDPGNKDRIVLPQKLVEEHRFKSDDPEDWALGYNGIEGSLLIFFPIWRDCRGDILRKLFDDDFITLPMATGEENRAIQYVVQQKRQPPDIRILDVVQYGIDVPRIYLWPQRVKMWGERHGSGNRQGDYCYLDVPRPFLEMSPLDRTRSNGKATRVPFNMFYDPCGNIFLGRSFYQNKR